MRKKSRSGETVHVSAGDIPAASPQDLARLRAAMENPIDTSELPEGTPGSRSARRAREHDRPAAPRSPIREAILRELGRQQITRYELWKRAHEHCLTLSESAVYEFLRGRRQIGLPYVEALMAAAGISVCHNEPLRLANLVKADDRRR